MKKLVLYLCFALLSLEAFAQVKVNGVIRDEKGQTLPSAIVAVKKSADQTVISSVTADLDGKYSLECEKGNVLEVYYMGYETASKVVGDETQIDFDLSPDASTVLNETVVIGYGSVKKVDLTGSVTNVKMSEVRSAAITGVDQALQGRIAGADIMSTTGEPGAATSIRIRGSRSITASNEPLYIVDGVMDAITDLGDINPADIESISVLKDASSTAIYGSRGANGVIIITTRTGESSVTNKPSITFKAEAGISQLPRTLDIMDGNEFARYRMDYMAWNEGYYSQFTEQTPLSDCYYPNPFNTTVNTNWIKSITRVAPYQNYFLSVSGSGKGLRYYASLGYQDNQGIIRKSGLEKINGRFTFDYQLFKWLKIGYSMSYIHRNQDNNLVEIGGSKFYSAAMYLSPLLRPNDSENPYVNGSTRYNSPIALIEQNTDKAKSNGQTHMVFLEAKFLKNFKLRSQNTYYGYDYNQYRYYPSTLPAKTEGEGGEAYRQATNIYTLTSENTLSYDRTFKRIHHFDALVGFTGYRKTVNVMSASGSGYANDDSMWNGMNAVLDKETYNVNTSSYNINKMSTYVRLNYNYRQTYYFTFTARGDGSSNFAANKKWGFFPSGAFKWNISKEKWMKRARNIDELSLKLSAGVTGNDAISAYKSMSIMSSSTTGYLFDGKQPVYYQLARIESPDLTWEKTALYNVALTGSFWGSRLNFTLEGYYARTTDLLLNLQTAHVTGYTTRLANIGKTSNRGVELSIDTRNIVRRNFTWTTSFTISHNKQMVDNIGSKNYENCNPSSISSAVSYMMYGYKEGYPLNALWGFKYEGVWHNQDEIDRNKITHAYASATEAQGKTLGAPKYVDINHDGTLDADDLCYLGNADPIVYGGLQNTFSFYGIDLGIFFAYSVGGGIYNFSELYMAGSYTTNQYRYMENAWHPTRNPEGNLPRAGITDKLLPCSLMLHDASFLRLKTLSIAYTLKFKKEQIFKDLKFSLVCDNVLLWKNYNGFDPDVSTNSEGSTLRRLDLGAYPKARTIIFGIQLRY